MKVLKLIAVVLLAVTLVAVTSANPFTVPPTDPDNDGLYEDVNGNGVGDYADIILLFESQDFLYYEFPTMIPYFDFNGNGFTDFADIIALYLEIGAPAA